MSSESLASICSGLQTGLDNGVADITELPGDLDKNTEATVDITQDPEEEMDQETSSSEEIEAAILESAVEASEEEEDDGLMNVNVKERRQCLMQMLNTAQVLKNNSLDQNATLSRLAAKNAAVVKMAVQNLNNMNTAGQPTVDNTTAASILAIEANSKVKMMVSKFDGGGGGPPVAL